MANHIFDALKEALAPNQSSVAACDVDDCSKMASEIVYVKFEDTKIPDAKFKVCNDHAVQVAKTNDTDILFDKDKYASHQLSLASGCLVGSCDQRVSYRLERPISEQSLFPVGKLCQEHFNSLLSPDATIMGKNVKHYRVFDINYTPPRRVRFCLGAGCWQYKPVADQFQGAFACEFHVSDLKKVRRKRPVKKAAAKPIALTPNGPDPVEVTMTRDAYKQLTDLLANAEFELLKLKQATEVTNHALRSIVEVVMEHSSDEVILTAMDDALKEHAAKMKVIEE